MKEKIIAKHFSNKILDLIGKKVYTESGTYLGIVQDVSLSSNKISGLKIKLDENAKEKHKIKEIIINYSQVKAIKEIIIIKDFEIDN